MVADTRVTVEGHVQWHEGDGSQIWTVESTVLSDEALRSMGLIGYWAAWLETAVEIALIDLLGGPGGYRRAKTMTKDMTASQMLTKAKALVNEAEAPAEGALEALTKAATALQSRNRLLHGAMGGHLVDGKVSLTNRRREELSEVADSELRAVAEELFDAMMSVSHVHWTAILR